MSNPWEQDWTSANAETPASGNPWEQDWSKPQPVPKKPSTGSYLAKSAEAGGRSLLAAGARVIDALNPFTTSEEDAAILFKNDAAGLKDFRENNAGMFLSRFAAEQSRRANEVMQGAAPATAGGTPVSELKYATLDPQQAAYLSPTRIASDVLESLPSSAALVAAAYFTRGKSITAGRAAFADAAAKGATTAEATAAAQAAATKAGAEVMAKAGAAGEGAIGYGQQYDQTLQEALKIPEETYAKAPAYKELLDQGFDPEAAHLKLANQIARQSSTVAGVVDAATNILGGKVLGKIIGEGGKLVPRVAKGFASEAATETVQSGGEQLGQNLALQQANPEQNALQGVGEAMVQGGVVGGVSGGATAAGFGGAHPQQPAPQPTVEDQARAVFESTDMDSAIAAANALSTANTQLDTAISGYLNPNVATATAEAAVPSTQEAAARLEAAPLGAPAAGVTEATRQALDRQAELAGQANVAGTAFERQSALEQAQVARGEPAPGAAAGYADLTPMAPLQARQRLAVMRDQAAQAGENPLELQLTPHPQQQGALAIRRAPLPSLELPAAPAAPAPAEAQQRVESAALAGKIQERRNTPEERGRQALVTRTLQAIEQRGGVASPEEARVVQQAGLGKPYDRIDQGLAAQPKTEAEKLTAATGLAVGNAPREEVVTTQQREAQAAELQRENAARPAPAANAVIAALATPAAQRTDAQRIAVTQSRERNTPADHAILELAATAPFKLSQEQRLRLQQLRGERASVAREAPAGAAPRGERLVDATQLASGKAAVTAEGKQTMTRETHALLTRLARVYGKQVQLFEGGARDGYVSGAKPNTVFLNVNASKPHLVVFGHEMLHSLKTTSPKTYAALETAIKGQLKEGALEEFKKDYGAEGADTEEIVADIVGNRMADEQFWSGVFSQMDAPEVAKLGMALVNAINKAKAVVASLTGFKTDALVKDLDAAKAAVQKAMREFAAERRGVARVAQAAPTLTEEATARPPARERPAGAEQPQEPAAFNAEEELAAAERQMRASPQRQSLEEFNKEFGKGAETELGAEEAAIRNNASGESAASLEAQSRVAQERAAGRVRLLVRRDGTVQPLFGVGAVDQRAGPGQLIVQRNVGRDAWTVLEEGPDVSKSMRARALLVAARYDTGERASPARDLPKIRGLAKIEKNLTPAERKKLNAGTAQRLVEQWDKLPHTDEFAAAAYAGKAKRGWYKESARAIAQVFGVDGPRFAALLAAMSPQNSVQTNLLNTLNTWKNWIAADRPTGREEIIDIMGRSVEGARGRESVLGAWINNSVRALAGENPGEGMLSGPKVNSFMRNLLGDVNEVTNDAWMANFALVDQNMFAGGGVKIGGETIKSKTSGYLAMNAKVRAAAARLTELTGDTWTPAEVQETVWSWAKTLYEAQVEGATARDILYNEELTDDMIRSTPDFKGLFHDDKYAAILRDAGYGEELDRLDRGGAGAQVAAPGGEAAPFASGAQAELLDRAAARLERLKEQGKPGEERASPERPGQLNDVEAYHYSTAPRESLASSAFGTGLKGSAREEYQTAADTRRRQRISFYFDKGTGVRPEAGVGGYPHKAVLNNIYDANADPLHLKKGSQAATETAILDAGFDGYLDRLEGSQPGQVIMLGQRSIPVQPLEPGPVTSTPVVEPLAAPAATWKTQSQGELAAMQQKAEAMRSRPSWAKYSIRVTPTAEGQANLEVRENGAEQQALPGAPRVPGATGPDPQLVAVADTYAAEQGLSKPRQSEYVQIDEAFAKRVAAAYEAMPNAPQDPKVREAYAALIEQTRAQYDALTKAGYEFSFFDGSNDPYKGNPWNAMRDLRENQRMAVFSTEAGFGSSAEFDASKNPMLEDTGLKWPDQNGKPKRVLANDLFRAVHDAFGHGLEGAGFRAQGEENAWQAHSRMFTGDAVGALTTETRGQNSWLNFGPHGEANRNANVENTVFADQKTGLMPEWTWTENVAPNAVERASPARWDIAAPTKADNAIRYLQDKQIDTKRVVQAIRKQIGELDEKWNPYLQEELYHGRTAKQTHDFLDFELRPLLQELQARGETVESLETYLHNRHAEERNIQVAKVNPDMPDGGSGIKTADARAYLAALPPEQRVKMDALAKRVDAINRKTEQLLVSSGLEKQSTIDAWNGAYKSYVPLQRAEFEEDVSGGVGQGMSARGAASKRAMGSEKEVSNILANVASQRERAVTRAEKNRVATAVYGLAIKAPNTEFWKPFAPDRMRNDAKVEQELVSLGMSPPDAANVLSEPQQRFVDPRSGRVVTRANPLLRSDPNVLSLRVNGEDRFVMFNHRDERANNAVRALKNLDADQLGRVLSTVGKFSRYFSSVNTQWNPIFGTVNFTRDVSEALVNLSTTPIADMKAQVLKDSGSALLGIIADLRAHREGRARQSKWAQLFEEFQNAGGQTGYRDSYANPKERSEALKSEFESISHGKLRGAGKYVLDLLSDYNESMENAVRLAAYKAGKDKGLTNAAAASVAKNLTVNFNRKGDVALQAGALYAFFNASVQGTARLAQTLTGPAGKKIIIGGLLLGVVQALLLSSFGFDKDEPPDFVKDTNLILPAGGGKYVSVPLPMGLRILPSSARRITEWMMSGGRDTGTALTGLLGMVVGAFNPIGGGTLLQTFAPTVADPLAALAENKDFAGRSIAREDFNSLKPTPGFLRAKDAASGVGRAMSYMFNRLSGGTDYTPGAFSPTPDQIDYLVGQATGGIGREVLKASATAKSMMTGEELPLYKVPLLGRFLGDTTGQAGVASKFYANLKALNLHEEEIAGRRKGGEGATVLSYIKENPEAVLAPLAAATEREVSAAKKLKARLLDKGAEPEKIKAIEARITLLMSRLNAQVARRRGLTNSSSENAQ